MASAVWAGPDVGVETTNVCVIDGIGWRLRLRTIL